VPVHMLVTGASGYIGRNLVARLRDDVAGSDVLGVDRSVPHDGVGSVRRVDLAAASATETADLLKGSDTVFHLAAARTDWGLDYGSYERDNVVATRRLIEAARIAGVRRWVYFGTVGVYGPSAEAIDESSPMRPDTDYGRTKAIAENELVHAADRHGWSLRILRPSAVFSEEQPDNTNLYRLIEAIRRRRFVMIGDGSEIKTTSYLHNVVDAALWLWRDLASGGIKAFNYVDEPKMTTRQMVDLIRSHLGVRLTPPRLPLWLVEKPAQLLDWIGDMIGRDLPITAARIRKFCTATNFDASLIRRSGFTPRFSTSDALARTVAWHKEGMPGTRRPTDRTET
jgi:nucleoside-diphosphate-sugar epimerase